MTVKTIVVGPLQVNCYIIADPRAAQALVIDPGDEPDMIMEVINRNRLSVTGIVCTHGHFDHIGAVGDIKQATGAPVFLHEEDLDMYRAAAGMAGYFGLQVDPPPHPDRFLNEADQLQVGDATFTVFHTPGHSPGGLSLYGAGMVITGDVIFAGSIGRTDLPGGDIDILKKSFLRLMALPETTRLLSGHGPESTIGRERRDNPFMALFSAPT